MNIFEIQVYKDFDVFFRLIVCQTRKAMLAAIKKDSAKIPDSVNPTDNTMGMFQPTPSLINGDIPGTGYSNMFGTMYLNLEDLSDEVIVHECAHAAFCREYNIRHYNGHFDDDSFNEQEEFCYFIGKAAKIVRKTIRQNFKIKRGQL